MPSTSAYRPSSLFCLPGTPIDCLSILLQFVDEKRKDVHRRVLADEDVKVAVSRKLVERMTAGSDAVQEVEGPRLALGCEAVVHLAREEDEPGIAPWRGRDETLREPLRKQSR